MKLNNRKVRILRKLVESGADTEKKILDLGLVEIIKISKSTSLSFQEMELKKETKEMAKKEEAIQTLEQLKAFIEEMPEDTVASIGIEVVVDNG